ncbi:MAG: 1-acyl-sn-glycerol-3-phosphate acyltransferase [Clostridiales bacterium]|nr:1-acyl-sn-glycerol-3-phosphate acyltransferase [Clostridiales bacterium]
MKLYDFSQVRDYRFYHIAFRVVKIIAKVIFRIKYEGTENVPETGALVVASNHICLLDPVFIGLGSGRTLHYMSKSENFENRFLRWFYTNLNAFPVNRGHADRSAIEYAIKIVEGGGALGIFPEGTRSKDLTPQRPKSGAAFVARVAACDILPVSVYSESKIKMFSKITIRYGKPIPFEELGFTENGGSRELRTASRKIMDEIEKLWELKH